MKYASSQLTTHNSQLTTHNSQLTTHSSQLRRFPVLITDVEAIILRQPDVDSSKADGSQDALLIRIQTDEGITGIGEVDSLPPVIKAIVDAPPSHSNASGLKSLVIGEDPLEIDRLWEKMYRGSIYYGRRSAAIHAMSGIDIALWDIKGKAL